MDPCDVQSPEEVALCHSWLFTADTLKFLELPHFDLVPPYSGSRL